MTFEVDPNPPGVGPSHLTITLAEENGTLIDNAILEVTGTMPQEDMQLRMAKARPASNGRYETPFLWAIAGDWLLTVNATLSNGQVAEHEFKVAVAEKMSINLGADGNHARPEQIPNDGAVIHILSPQEGAVFEAGDDVSVEIEPENFTLGVDGNHWHLYVNNKPGVMILGKMNEAVLRNLDPGQYQISTHLSVGSHKDLEEAAVVTITVLEPGEQNLAGNN